MINTCIVEGVSVCPIMIYLSSVNLEKITMHSRKIMQRFMTYRVVAKEKVKPAHDLIGPSGRRLSLEQRTMRKIT